MHQVVLKHANKKKKLVVIASTSEVYGKSTDVPFREDADLVLQLHGVLHLLTLTPEFQVA